MEQKQNISKDTPIVKSLVHSTTKSTDALEQPVPLDRLPWAGLLALAMTCFIGILTETLPAGLLPQISFGLGISEASAGQLVTWYALGSLLAAIPLTALTRNWPRRSLLLVCIVAFLLFNTITAVSASYLITVIARFGAGVAAGVLWGMVAGYARRLVSDRLKGRAMAIAMSGTPIALALGVPLGTFLGNFVGWRWVFGMMSLLSFLLIFWIYWKLPNVKGQTTSQRYSLSTIFCLPGVRPILSVVFIWVLAHNILYTYIAPYLSFTSLAQRTDVVLLVFGGTSIIGIWITGALIDRWLRKLVLISIAIFTLAAFILGIGSHSAILIMVGVVLWGVTFGGAATLLQTALAEATGEQADVAQSMLVTSWNLAISGGAALGGLLLLSVGSLALPWVLMLLALVAFVISWTASRYSFVPNSSVHDT